MHQAGGDDFYEWFLGPRMIYTSGIVLDQNKEETLEQLQDNKLTVVCEKLALKPSDRLLDIGCGWGTLAAFAAKNYGCEVTGITLGKNQTKFGNDRAKANGVEDKAKILCMDYREIPNEPGRYTKIVSLEMAEVGYFNSSNIMSHVAHSFCIGSTLVSDGIMLSYVRSMIFWTTMGLLSFKSLVSVRSGNTRI
jgi:cyclopropane fatty-acyl-phospholipid synthase-like methyltransferase